MPGEIKILSAGAVQPGLKKVVQTFRREGGRSVTVEFATAPELRIRLAGGESAQIVIAPTDLLEELSRAGKAAAERTIVGRIGVGVLVRRNLALPKVATVEELKQSLLDSTAIVFNQASTGLYIDRLLKRLSIAAQSESKIARCANFAAVRDRISHGHGNEIGFGATTVIVENTDNGIAFGGPLPAALQNYTTYGAALTINGGNHAAEFMDYLATPGAKALLTAAGIQ